MDWLSSDFFEKLGTKVVEMFSKAMNYTAQAMSFFSKSDNQYCFRLF